MIVTWFDIAKAAYEAGFRGESMATAIALTWPESGRESTATNSSDPNGGSFGLMQINGVHDPNASGTYPNKVPTRDWIQKMYDPTENMKAAYNVWLNAGRSFKPWGAYTSGLHLSKTMSPYDVAKAAMDGRQRWATSQNAVVSQEAIIKDLLLANETLRTSVKSLESKIEAALSALTQGG